MIRLDLRALALAGLSLGLLAGCVPPEDEPLSVANVRAVKPYVPTALAGLPVSVSTDANALKGLIARASRFGNTSDPFRLLPNEVQFERSQTAERLFADQGPFNLEYQPPVQPDPGQGGGQAAEPQPYRRLSGIVIGDAIVGILETQGQDTVIIRPGQYIPGTEWRVVLINEDRAVLRRAGNRLPKEVTVNLELPPPGFGPTGNTGGNTGRPGSQGGNRNGGPGTLGGGDDEGGR